MEEIKESSHSVKVLTIIALALISICLLVYYYLDQGEKARADTFAKCLTEQNAAIYGASWCTHCYKQRKALGFSKYLNYTECSDNPSDEIAGVCREINITVFPTWIINGTRYIGEQDLEFLQNVTGCWQ